MIAAVITIGSGPLAVALTLPSLDGSIPLDGRVEATLRSAPENLDSLDTGAGPVDATPFKASAAGTVESPMVADRTTNGPAADHTTAVTDTAAVTNAAAVTDTAVVPGIPADYLDLYRDAAATCRGLDWSVLAAIGKLESNHGRSTLPGVRAGSNPYGAKGPMQFLQSTFNTVITRHPVPPGGAAPPSPHNPHDAVHAAAAYLCDNGARDNRDLRGALYTYNHSRAYVTKVLDAARDYGRTTLSPPAPARPAPPAGSASPTGSAPKDRPAPAPRVDQRAGSAALAAVAFARAQIGKPYVWGGNGNPGFDCSGLTKASYAAAKTAIPRTAQSQYNSGPRLPAGAALQPGDLLFFGTSHNIHHVGISLGGTRMIHSPTFGKTVRIQDYRELRNFVGASRPIT